MLPSILQRPPCSLPRVQSCAQLRRCPGLPWRVGKWCPLLQRTASSPGVPLPQEMSSMTAMPRSSPRGVSKGKSVAPENDASVRAGRGRRLAPLKALVQTRQQSQGKPPEPQYQEQAQGAAALDHPPGPVVSGSSGPSCPVPWSWVVLSQALLPARYLLHQLHVAAALKEKSIFVPGTRKGLWKLAPGLSFVFFSSHTPCT